MPEDDREDMPTAITTSPTSAIEQALEDGPTGVAKAPDVASVVVLREGERAPADDDGPTSISRVPTDQEVRAEASKDDPHEDAPTGVTKVELPPPDEVPTGRTARPPGIAPPGLRIPERRDATKKPPEPDPEEDSLVTLQKPIPEPSDDDSIVTIQPAKAPTPPKTQVAQRDAPPKQKADAPVDPITRQLPKEAASDIYDVDEDRTERRDLPVEEINRAIAHAKQRPVAISELPDESPTARRSDLAITPKSGVKVATLDDDDEQLELSTETDLGPTVRRALANDVVRPPFASDADQVITEPRIDGARPDPRVNLKKTMPLSPARSSGPAVVQKSSVLTPPPRPPEPAELGTDSYTFQGGAGALQAVIPVTSSGKVAAVQISSAPPPPPPSGLLLAASGAPSTQSMSVQQQPSFSPPASPPPAFPQGPMQSGNHLLATMPTQPATFPPGLPPSMSSSMPVAQGPASGRLPAHGSFAPAPPSGQMGPTGPAIYEQPREEPRWIVLVLGVLALSILIPTILYFVLRPKPDDSAPEETPVRPVVTVQTAQPKDVGKRGK
jgi:hypothetical protein